MGKRVYLGTTHPELASQWHPTLNTKLPSQVTAGSDYKAWWVCSIGHPEWSAPVNNRANGSRCPSCSGRRAVRGVTDLEFLRPDLSAEWHPEFNELAPSEVTLNSNRLVWWICRDGHVWDALIQNRAIRGTGCPKCSGRFPIVGESDLETLEPELSAMWDTSKNEIGPHQVTRASSRFIWWVGECGHGWKRRVYNALAGNRCPHCRDNMGSENFMVEHLSNIFGEPTEGSIPELRWKNGSPFKVDYLSTNGLVVEFDGEYWHKGASSVIRDITKTEALLNAGYLVVRLRQIPLDFLPISHKNFSQFHVKWDDQGKGISYIMEDVSSWYNKMTRRKD